MTTDPTDELLPLEVHLQREEVELFDPAPYRERAIPEFVDHFLRDRTATFATDLEPYLERYLPHFEAYRDRPAFHIYMTNRCGSTLLVNALSHHPRLACFNELDPWVLDLYADTTDEQAFRINQALGTHVRRWSVAVDRIPLLKHRAEALLAAPILSRAFPTSRALFLYRHPDAVIASQLAKAPRSAPGSLLHALERTCPSAVRLDPALPARVYAAFYLDTLERYRAAVASSAVPSAWCCIRYEELCANPRRWLAAIASFFGLELEGDTLERMVDEWNYDAKARAGGESVPFAPRTVHVELEPEVRQALDDAWAQELPGDLAFA